MLKLAAQIVERRLRVESPSRAFCAQRRWQKSDFIDFSHLFWGSPRHSLQSPNRLAESPGDGEKVVVIAPERLASRR